MIDCKLSECQIAEIAEAHKAGRSLRSLAEEFGASYKWLSRRLKRRGLFVRGRAERKLSDEQIAEIAKAHKAGRSLESLAREYGLTVGIISKWLKRRGLFVRGWKDAVTLHNATRACAPLSPRKRSPRADADTPPPLGWQLCKGCKKFKPPTDFAENKKYKGRKVLYCADCKEKGLRYRQNLRAELLKAYGGRCACCGEATPEFLSVDHVYNDGAEHRREMRASGFALYTWLRRKGFPKDRFQLLCHNCNFAKGQYGECPHEAARRAEATPAAA